MDRGNLSLPALQSLVQGLLEYLSRSMSSIAKPHHSGEVSSGPGSHLGLSCPLRGGWCHSNLVCSPESAHSLGGGVLLPRLPRANLPSWMAYRSLYTLINREITQNPLFTLTGCPSLPLPIRGLAILCPLLALLSDFLPSRGCHYYATFI